MKNQFILSIVLFYSVAAFAQNYYELDLHYGFGVSELSFCNAPGLALSIYPNPKKNFSFSAGLEYSFRQKTKTSSITGENPIATDIEGDDYIFMYSFDKYEETRSIKMLQIPLLLKYRFQPKSPSFYASAGLKIGAPIKVNSKINYKGLNTSGNYVGWDLNLTKQPFQGFGKQNDSSFATKISSKNLFMLAFEHGISFDLSDNFVLLAGVFADYSLNKGFNRDLPNLVERTEEGINEGAYITVSDTWKSWRPWSFGLELKIAFGYSGKKEIPPDTTPAAPVVPDRDHFIEVVAESFLAPIPAPEEEKQIIAKEPKKEFVSPALPDLLLNRKPEFVFIYPEKRTSPSDSAHVALITKIADTLKVDSKLQTHCVGYSEKLASESVAYEAALQRSLRIKYTLGQFYGIDESRMFIYSQGSKGAGQRRAECHVIKID